MDQPTLFPAFDQASRSPQHPPAPVDPCVRKHGGNEQSTAAWAKLTRSVASDRETVLAMIRAEVDGLTAKETAQRLGRQLNTLSGRFTELAKAGLIRRLTAGDRHATRDGAAVWVRTTSEEGLT